MSSKTGQKQPFWASFSRPSKTTIFGHFSCVDEFWWFHDVLISNFDDEMMLMTCRWWCRWRKSCSRGKKNEKNRPSAEPCKTHKNWARHGRRETAERKGHKERLWRDRVRMTLPGVRQTKKKKKNEHHWEWHAECERSDVRDVLRHMRSILTWVTYPTGGTHESRRVWAQRSACGYHKSPWGFFDTKFHDGTQASESTHTRS
jgi:hypothetical protein